MSERDNAMKQGELVHYSETRRDELEKELAEVANKRELNYRKSNGITVIAYWLMKENVTTIWVADDRTNSAMEYEVDPSEVMTWFNHPFAHENANMPIYQQSENDGA